ncbi:putative amidohydrolase [Frankia canadensis]|uniref:Putative amidohydrolase n=1 Tax=Frankia canadensis TaxID=1836972 RepID=A0A2I2KMH5_9ACTN|nr:carbon-nitrogen family hydrolase [Frankia canadensis]SNQ46864.1 putative amidohydrolase [Frankia canadensis]SOU54154.1 putative amidohydrolase [Frankia canadensis]
MTAPTGVERAAVGVGPIRTVCLQLACPDGEPAADRVRRVLAELRAVEADLVVLPELWATGYFHFDDYAAQAEPLTGPLVSALRAAARDGRFHLVTGSLVERAEDGRLFNTSVLVDPAGEILLTYRKIHLFGHESDEARLLTPGTSAPAAPGGSTSASAELGGSTSAPGVPGRAAVPYAPTVGSALGRVALATCYDLRFPELFRLYADAGAELVVVVSAWPADRLAHWRVLARARAIENQVYLVACNAAGRHAGRELAGASVVVDPWGEVVAECDAREGRLCSELDPARVAAVREAFPVLTHRRVGVAPGLA